MLLYYITDRTQFKTAHKQEILEGFRQSSLLEAVTMACNASVDFIQLREKDLPTRQLETLASKVVAIVRETGAGTRLLINSRIDVAIAAGADGVHLRSDDISSAYARKVLLQAGCTKPIVGVSCHTLTEIQKAAAHQADLAVFGPVFGKQGSARLDTGDIGLNALEAACKAAAGSGMRVLALGGITRDNAWQCIDAGADGIAGIRLFQEANIAETVGELSHSR